VILRAIIWRKKATRQKWAKKYTVHWDKKLKSLCDNPVSCTTQPIHYPGDIRQMTSKIHAQTENFFASGLTLLLDLLDT
jgi:hypothetical protein